MVDRHPVQITALDPADNRAFEISVAGPAALLVSKLHKIGERRDTPGRLLDKDAHDIYRLLVAIPTDALAQRLSILRGDDLAGASTRRAIEILGDLFCEPDALGAATAGRAEVAVGSPQTVAASTAALATDLLGALSAQ